MGHYAAIERERLADALLAAGPAAPTLCAGWNTHDLAAHLVVRERRPDAAAGIVAPPLSGWADRVQRHYRDSRPYPDLVAMVRSVPWWSLLTLAPLDEATNLLELFVHHEDVRRAGPDWQPRTLEPGLAAALWRRVPGIAKLNLHTRGVREAVAVEAPGHGRAIVGTGEPTVTISGEPGELVLYFYGRRRVARVEVDGAAELADKLRGRGPRSW